MGTIRHATLTSELGSSKVGAAQWDEAHDIDLGIADISGLQDQFDARTGWAAFVNTAGAQAILANTKVALVNNAGSTITSQAPEGISLYSNGKILGRSGDSVGIGLELTFTPSDGVASNLYVAIDIGGAIGELYPREFAVVKGSGIPHRFSYVTLAYTLDTWAANGGTIKVEADGPGSITAVRYVIHRLHKAR